jgi:hypothetical protein
MSTTPRLLASLSAYATEGGLDGRYQPSTCYSPTIALGRHPGPGAAEGLWENYEAVVDLASRAGLGGICFELSWARLEPRRGRRDEVALARYAEVIARARRRGLWVTVAAIDAAWPAWLGLEAWLMPWVTPVASAHVEWIATSLDVDALSVFASRDLLTRGFLDERAGPPWRRGAREDAACARANLEVIERSARELSAVTVVSSLRVELDEFDDRDPHPRGVDEVHVTSLVRGMGPLAAGRGLLARRGQDWVVADEGLTRRLVARP